MRRAAYALLLTPAIYFIMQQPLMFYVVVSGSMEPFVPRGSLVVVEPGRPELGDVGAYMLELGGGSYVIVHRVVGVGDGFYAFRGDAGEGVEHVPADRVLGRVALSIPYVGYLYMAGLANPLLLVMLALAALLPNNKPSTLFPLSFASGLLAFASPGRGLTAVIDPLLYLLYSSALSTTLYLYERREGPHWLIYTSHLMLTVANLFSVDVSGVASWLGFS